MAAVKKKAEEVVPSQDEVESNVEQIKEETRDVGSEAGHDPKLLESIRKSAQKPS